MSIARHHAEWLSLLDVSGPFLSMPVLLRVFPHGLHQHDPDILRVVRQQYDTWANNQFGLKPDRAIHTQWVQCILTDVLGFPAHHILVHAAIPESIKVVVAEQHETIRPTHIISRTEHNEAPRVLIHVVEPKQNLEKPLAGAQWKASPATRMAELLRATDIKIGLVTNGNHWMLVHAPRGETTTFVSWYATLWLEEKITLQSFRTLLEARRFFGVADGDTLEALFKESEQNQHEVTDQLGYQVRQAVEMLVQTIDRLDKDTGRTLLQNTPETVLYEAALTVMMRLVFLLCAEERGLLRLGDELYDQSYAISPLRAALREAADQVGEEVLERRHDAWVRLLATFRVVHGGVWHNALTLPAYGGSLFDPDRYPFLEGRKNAADEVFNAETHIFNAETQRREDAEGFKDLKESSAPLNLCASALKNPDSASALKNPVPQNPRPLMVDNRTVMHLLKALQILRVKVPGGGEAEPRRLSFRALDIEQIGHVYEGLLDHTAKRATEPILGLTGTKDKEPEVPLAELERLFFNAEDSSTQRRKEAETQSYLHSETSAPLLLSDSALKELKDLTGRSEDAIKKALATPLTPHEQNRLRAACDNDNALFQRVLPFAGIVRLDTFERPVVITTGSVYVTLGTERRATGTHYTPRSLTEPVVAYALEPLVFHGPAEGLPRNEWQPRAPEEILNLKVCDMAMGSGAFLVQACRYLAERYVESQSKIFNAETQVFNAEAQRRRDAENFKDLKESSAPLNLSASALKNPESASALKNPEPEDEEEKLTIARRLIANRCLYGVDKNPQAVEIAKLSLWLTTLQKDKPFTFLDHALKCGDSLLGITDEQQLMHWELDHEEIAQQQQAYYQQKLPLLRPLVETTIDTVKGLRRRIAAKPVLDVKDAEEKARLLAQADQTATLIKLAADLLVASVLANTKKEREELHNKWELDLNLLLAAAQDPHTGMSTLPNQAAFAQLRAEADALLGTVRPFHWVLEFPEVFYESEEPFNAETQRREDAENLKELKESLCVSEPLNLCVKESWKPGFSVIIGNPPFQGGKRITGALGTPYRDYLIAYLARNKRGHADLCAYFFLRTREILQQNGMAGLLATNTIAQGDTREVGLDQLAADGYTIPRAVPSRPWPGTAGVVVAHIWLRYGPWKPPYVLDETPVTGITPYLAIPGKAAGTPYRLVANAGKSFVGSYILGMGFVLEPDAAQALMDKDARNKEVLFPFLNGEDLNTRPDQSPSRWVINFFDWTEEQAANYPDCWQIIQEKVRPERQRTNEKGEYVLRKPLPQRYWHYGDKRPALYTTIAEMKRVLVIPETTKHCTFSFHATNIVFSHAIKVIALEESGDFSLLVSSIHEIWVWQYSSTMGGTTLRYTPSDVFETFPFPEGLATQGGSDTEESFPSTSSGNGLSSAPLLLSASALESPAQRLEDIGGRYYAHRQHIMLTRQEGLTKTYNRFHNPDETSEDIALLRQLHAEMDVLVAQAYGWGDLALEHGFHKTKQGLRYTISEAARSEVLDRLLELNHARYAEEVRRGLHDKKRKRKKRG